MTQESKEEMNVGKVAPGVDEELMALAEAEPPSILRPVLMIGVIAMAAWIVSDWQGELEYFFSSKEPVEIGDVTDFASEAAEDPEWTPDIPHNRYVKVSGIPSRRSQSARYRYAKLVGGWVFVEIPRDDYIEDPIERELQGEQKAEVDRTYFEGSGRALAFREMPERYRGLRHYYTSRYNIRFCDELTPAELREIQNRRRDSIIQQWSAEFEAATEEERLERSLTPQPTEEEIADILANNPACVDAYLIQVDNKPGDQHWYVLAALLFLGFMVFNVFMLIRWVRRFLKHS